MFESAWRSITRHFVFPQQERVEDVSAMGFWVLEQLAAFLHTSLTNPSMKWLRLNATSEADRNDVLLRSWMDAVEEELYSVFSSPETKFNNQVHEHYIQLAAYGTAVMAIEQDVLSPFGLYYSSIPIQECYVLENVKGEVDVLYREFKLLGRDVLGRWPEQAEALDLTEEKLLEELTLLHVVEPHSQKEEQFQSVYLVKEKRVVLEANELDFFPYLVTRWSKRANVAYGTSPAMIGLFDLERLNLMDKMIYEGAQLQIKPPLFLPHNDMLHKIDRTPGGLNFFRSGQEKGYSLGSEGDVKAGEWMREKLAESLLRIFYVDKILLHRDRAMTATEVLQRVEEQIKMMSPVMARIESELLRPLVLKTYRVLELNGRIPEFPRSGESVEELKFEYISALSRGQRASEALAIERTLDVVNRMGDPEVLDNLDLDITVREMGMIHGVPAKIFREERAVDQRREERMKAMEAMEREKQAKQVKRDKTEGEPGFGEASDGMNVDERAPVESFSPFSPSGLPDWPVE